MHVGLEKLYFRQDSFEMIEKVVIASPLLLSIAVTENSKTNNI
jgi:hypothetical protein